MDDLVTHTEPQLAHPSGRTASWGPRPVRWSPRSSQEACTRRRCCRCTRCWRRSAASGPSCVVQVPRQRRPRRFSQIKRHIDGVSQKMLDRRPARSRKGRLRHPQGDAQPSHRASTTALTEMGRELRGATARHRQPGPRQPASRRGSPRALRPARGRAQASRPVIRRASPAVDLATLVTAHWLTISPAITSATPTTCSGLGTT